ncbi:coiled-coil domain-containing protein 1-like [Helianthus annuus]|uniref:coiled-coil domain-containing protein 1-like n=1 Tax=Helianthus annuus TaxID=4232 RepID=UPI000B901C22|nr:coiled-coil domain-containing protein 1-like [Helianthus annuus]
MKVWEEDDVTEENAAGVDAGEKIADKKKSDQKKDTEKASSEIPGLDDIPDMNFYDDKILKIMEEKIKKLEDKVKCLEAENVVLNDRVQILETKNVQLTTSNTMLLEENEQLKKIVDDHEEDRKLRDKKMDMLFAMFESKFGVSVEEEFNQIEIRKVEARRKDKSKVDDIPNITKFVCIGQQVTVAYSEEETERLDEVERRRNKDKKDDNEDEDEELKDVDDPVNVDDNSDDDHDSDDDNDQGGIGFQIVSRKEDCE